MSAIDPEGLRVKIESAEEYSEISVQLSVPWAKAILAALTWTPVSEGLPKKNDDYAVTDGTDRWLERWGFVDHSGAVGWECNDNVITHWKPIPPLPKPKPCEACDEAGVTCLREIIEPKPCQACKGSGKENNDG